MTYKIKVGPRTVEIEFETGSIKEATAILTDEGNSIAELFGSCPWATDTAAQEQIEPPKPAGNKRGPKPKNQPDPSTAQAPAPLPVNVAPQAPANVAPPPPPAPPAPPPIASAPPTAPIASNGDGLGIPAFLDRNLQTPPPPPAPPAPVVTRRLGGLIKAELEKRAGATPEGQASWVKWLTDCGVTIPGASFAEALAVVETEKDERLTTVAAQLGIQ